MGFLSFISPQMWKYAAYALILVGIYAAGHSQGHDSGYKEGHVDGVASTQKQITDLKADVGALTKIVNDNREALALKAEAILNLTSQLMLKNEQKLNSKIDTRTEIVTKFIDNPDSAKCGLDPSGVEALNKILDQQIELEDRP